MASVTLGSSFGQALCKHFNLDSAMVSADMKLNCGSDEIFSATLSICLTADDIVTIGLIMQGVEK